MADPINNNLAIRYGTYNHYLRVDEISIPGILSYDVDCRRCFPMAFFTRAEKMEGIQRFALEK